MCRDWIADEGCEAVALADVNQDTVRRSEQFNFRPATDTDNHKLLQKEKA